MEEAEQDSDVGACTDSSLLRPSREEPKSSSELLEVFRKFSRVREGVLLKVKKARTLLHLSPEHARDTDYINLGFISLKEDDHLLLYQIESSRITNVHYIWQPSQDIEKESDISSRRLLDTTTFYFLTTQGNEVVKCFFVIGNETLNSLKLFFSMFEIVGEGFSDEQLSSMRKSRKNDQAI